jgi:hypothetical protein
VTSFPQYVCLFEVPFSGRVQPQHQAWVAEHPEAADRHRARQRFDVLAIGVWSKTQHLVHGFELKVSRADLLHELRDLTKSEVAARMVDRFWLVLGDRALLKDTDPVPESWGILVARGRGLTLVREPAPQAGEIDRSLVLGIATRALVSPTIGREARYRDGWIRGRREGYDVGLYDGKHGTDRRHLL